MGTSQSIPNAPQRIEASDSPYALVVCGPSGVGKGTLIKSLMEINPDSFGFSVSHTSRAPRPGEQDGVHYHFTSKQDMKEAIKAGLFLEYAEVHGNYYGTSIKAVNDVSEAGKCCVLDIDVQGARLVRKSDLKAIFVFVAPPSEEELLKRLRGRGTETEESMATRLANAKIEMESIQEPGLFDFLIVNDDLESSQQQLYQVAALALAGQDPAELDVKDDAEEAEARTEGPVNPKEDPETQSQTEKQPLLSNGGSEATAEEEEGTKQEPGEAQAAAESTGEATVANDTTSAGSSLVAELGKGLTSWAGMVAVVTGASSGIGWATTLELLQGGVKVVAVARRRDKLERLQAYVVDLGVNPVDFLPIVCDVTKEAEVLALPRIISKRWPGAGIDILVNNAGVGRADGSLTEGSTGAWVEMVSTNILGLSMCTREAVKDMARRGVGGHIINIGQLSGSTGSAEAFYAATKAAVRSLSEGLRAECQEKELPVRVTLISPSVVATEFNHAEVVSDTDNNPELLDRGLKAEDVAATVVWCLAAPAHVDVSEVALRAPFSKGSK